MPFESCFRRIKPVENCVHRINPADFVWVAYDDSKARLPVAMSPSVTELAAIMGVSRSTIESMWSKYRHGKLDTAKYAKVYIGGLDDD